MTLRSCFCYCCAVLTLLLHGVTVKAGPWLQSDTVTVTSDARLREVLRERLPPGATLLLAPGRYSGGISIENTGGTEGKPIVIGGADPKTPPVILGGNSGLHVRAPSYLELRDLVFEGSAGNGINIDDGSEDRPAHGVVIRNIVVRGMAGKGNNDAIKLSGLAGFRVENCDISGWGAGGGSGIDMVGCHVGKVTGCRFRQENAGGSNGVQAKGGSTKILIQKCDFNQAGQRAINIGGSTGLKFFRPQPPAGFEAKDITVRSCTFRGSLSPINFVGVDGAVVEDCILYRPGKWVIRILQENRDPAFVPSRNGVVRNNTVVFRSDEVRTHVNAGGGTSPETFVFQGNTWYCEDAPERSRPQLPTPEKNGVYGVDPKLKGPAKGDFSRG